MLLNACFNEVLAMFSSVSAEGAVCLPKDICLIKKVLWLYALCSAEIGLNVALSDLNVRLVLMSFLGRCSRVTHLTHPFYF